MRHKVKGRKLGRTSSHRLATLKSLATELFRNKKIKTTLAKAREARTFSEPLITKAKTDSVHTRRHVARFVEDRGVVQELFNEIIPKIGERPGGYTRIIKLGTRFGDAAEMAIIELVDYNEAESKQKTKKKSKTAAKKKSASKSETAATAEPCR